MKLANFNNKEFSTGASKLKQLLWYAVNSIIFNSYLFPVYQLKVAMLRSFGATVGDGVVIKPKVNIKYPWKLTIGNHVWIGEKAWIDNLAHVTIGNNVCISQEAYLLTGNHNYKVDSFDLITNEIYLEDEVWVGAKSVVCPGVTCRKGAILSVGSIATENLEKETIYQGNPAVAKKKRYP